MSGGCRAGRRRGRRLGGGVGASRVGGWVGRRAGGRRAGRLVEGLGGGGVEEQPQRLGLAVAEQEQQRAAGGDRVEAVETRRSGGDGRGRRWSRAPGGSWGSLTGGGWCGGGPTDAAARAGDAKRWTRAGDANQRSGRPGDRTARLAHRPDRLVADHPLHHSPAPWGSPAGRRAGAAGRTGAGRRSRTGNHRRRAPSSRARPGAGRVRTGARAAGEHCARSATPPTRPRTFMRPVDDASFPSHDVHPGPAPDPTRRAPRTPRSAGSRTALGEPVGPDPSACRPVRRPTGAGVTSRPVKPAQPDPRSVGGQLGGERGVLEAHAGGAELAGARTRPATTAAARS